MNTNELFAHWDVVRRGLFHALDRLTDEQLGFVPREGLWSLGTVARHIAGAEEGWFRYVVVRKRDGWPDYTAEDYPTVASIKGLLADVRARTVAYLETVKVGDIDRVVETPWGEKLSIRQVIWHVLEHEIHHRGEIYLMLGLLGMEAPEV